MTKVLEIRDMVIRIYKGYESYFRIIFKFLVAFFVFGYVNSNLGYFPVLNNMGIRLVLSLICGIVPSSIFVLLVAIVTLLHLYRLSLVMMLLAFVVFVVFYFLYLKFAPNHGVLMLLIPVLMPLNLHFIIPLIAGLFFSPFTIVPVACSFIMMSVVHYIIEAAPMVEDAGTNIEAIVAAYQQVIDNVLANREMVLYAVVFALIIVLTYVVSRFPFDYAWYAGIGAGMLAGIIGLLVGGNMLGVSVSAGGVIIGSILSALFTALIQFMSCTVDYAHKEFVQFEDDDYVYYVRAIPKTGNGTTVSLTRERDSEEKHKFSLKEGLKTVLSRNEGEDDVFDEDFEDGGPSVQVTEGKASEHTRVFEEDKTLISQDTKVNASDIIIPEIKIPEKPNREKAPERKKAAVVSGTSKTARTGVALGVNRTQKNTADTKTAATGRKPAASKTASAKAAETQALRSRTKASERSRELSRNFDFDFDDDGYDDSMEDYSSDD